MNDKPEAEVLVNALIKLLHVRWNDGRIDTMERDILINQLKHTLYAITGDAKYNSIII
jgi:hypothetical protein